MVNTDKKAKIAINHSETHKGDEKMTAVEARICGLFVLNSAVQYDRKPIRLITSFQAQTTNQLLFLKPSPAIRK